jgi:hypothetical protein
LKTFPWIEYSGINVKVKPVVQCLSMENNTEKEFEFHTEDFVKVKALPKKQKTRTDTVKLSTLRDELFSFEKVLDSMIFKSKMKYVEFSCKSKSTNQIQVNSLDNEMKIIYLVKMLEKHKVTSIDHMYLSGIELDNQPQLLDWLKKVEVTTLQLENCTISIRNRKLMELYLENALYNDIISQDKWKEFFASFSALERIFLELRDWKPFLDSIQSRKGLKIGVYYKETYVKHSLRDRVELFTSPLLQKSTEKKI